MQSMIGSNVVYGNVGYEKHGSHAQALQAQCILRNCLAAGLQPLTKINVTC